MIHLDFESRSEVDIWDCGAYIYASHPSTEVLCLAYAIDDDPVVVLNREELKDEENTKDLIDRINKGELVTAHNAFFEQCIWEHKMLPLGWPIIPIHQWRCSAAKACAHALPKALGNCGAALNLPIQKSLEGKRIMMKLCKPRRKTKYNNEKWYEEEQYPDDFQALYEYCATDVEAERAVDEELRDLNKVEQRVWFLDQVMNRRGVYVDVEAIKAALYIIEQYTDRLTKEAQNISDGFVDKVSRRLRVMNWVERQGVEITGYTKQEVQTLVADKNIPDHVRRLLEIRLQLGKTSTAKYQAMQKAAGRDNRIRDTLIYHGASTGRWAGKLVQLQNIPRGSIKDTDTCIDIMKMKDMDFFEDMYPDVMGAISSCIRGMICAPKGRELIVADYNAIEARVVMWLANDIRGLTKFRKGEDLYVDIAQIIYAKDNISKSERQLGKTAVLGCGYGMGPSKFHQTCNAFGLSIPVELAERSVAAYRNTYLSVRNMWYDQERAAIAAVRTSKVITCGYVKWGVSGDFLYCRLPSGRCLAYYAPRIDIKETPWGEKKEALFYMTVMSQTNKWIETNTYGGKLVENITQAVARDIMAEAMLRLEAKKYPVIFSVHDEVVAEVPKGIGSVSEFEKLLTELPSWAEGCPIKAEGWRGKRYKK